jgi:hypothetical protein
MFDEYALADIVAAEVTVAEWEAVMTVAGREVARMRYEYASAPINAAREAAIQFRNQWRNLI